MSDPAQKFVDVSKDLFASRGLHGVSLSDVARELGLTKQSVLYHFKTKQALFGAVLGDVAARLNGMLDEVRGAGVSDADRVSVLIDALHMQLMTHPQDARIIARELADNPGRIEGAKSLPLHDFVEDVTAILAAHPAALGLSDARIAAASYQLIGAILFFAVSEPTLRTMWGADRMKSVSDVFLPVLKEAWGA
ncbi:MAG: TetR/AcrR family transcriptional regulator [Pseudomonadota bacterium]